LPFDGASKVSDRVHASPFGDAKKKKQREVDMRRKLTWLVLACAAILIVAIHQEENVLATPANGFKATTIATGTFGEFDVFNQSAKDSAHGFLY
jgi:hypothetical protein